MSKGPAPPPLPGFWPDVVSLLLTHFLFLPPKLPQFPKALVLYEWKGRKAGRLILSLLPIYPKQQQIQSRLLAQGCWRSVKTLRFISQTPAYPQIHQEDRGWKVDSAGWDNYEGKWCCPETGFVCKVYWRMCGLWWDKPPKSKNNSK
jgi:hypothetical protein